MSRGFLALLFFVVVLPWRPAGADETLVRLTFGSGWDALPAIVGIERGFFDQQGLVVSGLAVSSAAGVMESVAVGSTGFAAVPQRAFIVMAASGLPVTAVSMNGWGTEMELVVPRSDGETATAADLKGKTVAITRGSEAHPVLIRLLNAAGLRPADVTVRQMPAEELLRALTEGSADAVFESRRFTEVLLDKGQARVVLSNERIVETLGHIGAQPLVVNNDLMEREPQTVQKFVNGWIRALAYIRQDPEDAAALLRIFFHRQGTRVSKRMVEEWIGMVRYDRHRWTADDIADAEYNAWALNVAGILKVRPELDDYIDNRFVEKAQLALQ